MKIFITKICSVLIILVLVSCVSVSNIGIESKKDTNYSILLSKVLIVIDTRDINIIRTTFVNSTARGVHGEIIPSIEERNETLSLNEYLKDKINSYFNKKEIETKYIIKGKLDLDESITENLIKEFKPKNIFYINIGEVISFQYWMPSGQYGGYIVTYVGYPIEFKIIDTEFNKTIWRARTKIVYSNSKLEDYGITQGENTENIDKIISKLFNSLQIDDLIE